MKILVINPNSTASMTVQIGESARRCAFVATEIETVNPKGTPASIEGHADEALSVPAMLELIRAGEARGPVIGICQAAVQVATTIATRFSIVTTLPRSVPIIEDLVEAYGAGHRCRNVRAVDMPVLALESDPITAEARLVREIEAARDQDGAEAVVLLRGDVGALRAAAIKDRGAGD